MAHCRDSKPTSADLFYMAVEKNRLKRVIGYVHLGIKSFYI